MQDLLKRLRTGIAAFMIAAAPSSFAYAQDNAADTADKPVVSTLEALVVERNKEGDETFRKAKRVNPGELIEYRIAHKNQSGDALKRFIVHGQIPAGTTFVGGSDSTANEAKFEVLVPGEKWQKEPAYKIVEKENGTKERMIAQPSEYSSIRWVLNNALAADAAATGTYRVKVNTN